MCIRDSCWSLWKNMAKQDPAFRHPEKFCSDIAKTNWESATVTTLDDKILPYIEKICQRDPRSGKTVTGGIVSCKDSSWLLSWTINRQGQFKEQDKDKVCVWVYGLFTDVPGDFIKKPMKECTGKEITEAVSYTHLSSASLFPWATEKIRQDLYLHPRKDTESRHPSSIWATVSVSSSMM